MLLTRAAGYDPAQIESWLAELIGVAIDTSRNDSSDHPISALLRHGLSGLLFSHAELWHHTPQDPPCSIAFIATQDRVSFGWAGPAQVEVWVDGQLAEGPWIRVRDPDGRGAQALEVESWHRVRLHLSWSASGIPGEDGAVEVIAEWPGLAAVRTASSHAGSAARAPASAFPAVADVLSQWRTPSWLKQQGAPVEPVAAPMVPAAAPPPAAVPERPAPSPEAPKMEPPRPAPEAAQPAPDTPGSEEPLEIVRGMDPGAPLGSAPPLVPPPGVVAKREPELSAPLEFVANSHLEREPAPEPPPLEIVAKSDLEPEPGSTPPLEVVRSVEPQAREAEARRRAPPRARDRSPGPAIKSAAILPLGASVEDPGRTGGGRAGSGFPLRRVRRPSWPVREEVEHEAGWWRGRGGIAAMLIGLFAIGWILGGFPGGRGHDEASPFARALAALGLGPARGLVVVDSHPQGAWIAIDGRDLARRTPATIEVAPGRHQITVSVANLGSASSDVEVARDQRVAVDTPLWGALGVRRMDKSILVKVSVDDVPRGLAPVIVEGLAPGVHHVQFWSPGAGSWDQIIEVRVRDTAEVVARPFASPATGLLEVRATLATAGAAAPVPGATVWIDGEVRGVTPLPLELARGPHSVRVAYNGQDSPVQVIDLPGGNQRFATFDLTFDPERPRLIVPPPGRLSRERPTLVSATLERVSPGDVSEMWLHLSGPEGAWRRYPMNVLKAPGGSVGAAVFPLPEIDARGRARYYVSASTRGGDEYFTEIQIAQGPPGANTAATR